jgi:2,4-dienoyl-CoA reductase-like NADH-dependent reductase (Old Yellow Enzyme family)
VPQEVQGLIIQEATSVSPEGRISPEDLGLWKDEQIEKLVQINQFIVSQHSVPEFNWRMPEEKQAVLLLGMAIKTGCHRGGWETVAPSAIPFQDTDTMPVALDKSGIEKVIADFKAATIRSVKALQVMEIHAAHGYLLHQFLSLYPILERMPMEEV